MVRAEAGQQPVSVVDSFRFEQLDRLSPDLSDMARKDELKKRATLWIARLGAEAL
ncbi:hypothetical protein [Brevundimonas sp.]|uniref:hypothetical protein n=1 Tax=Brevundimonas sp. TaxID=1871086 RepID=UPI0028AD0333|nr:hypothetical protein [Brevundimonas sp.]